MGGGIAERIGDYNGAWAVSVFSFHKTLMTLQRIMVPISRIGEALVSGSAQNRNSPKPSDPCGDCLVRAGSGRCCEAKIPLRRLVEPPFPVSSQVSYLPARNSVAPSSRYPSCDGPAGYFGVPGNLPSARFCCCAGLLQDIGMADANRIHSASFGRCRYQIWMTDRQLSAQ